ncbi:hypothetical protein LR48_Vigan312s001200 [Vigna angularis]|uniref:Uncharacterized protein n=1 Tax=Phaseolus angularis TaxID=3914 RepID=A0A0L9T8P2_PHAAN|nr:hypothetical protein LR48_Vigan312s001200 [Vigna angularis]
MATLATAAACFRDFGDGGAISVMVMEEVFLFAGDGCVLEKMNGGEDEVRSPVDGHGCAHGGEDKDGGHGVHGERRRCGSGFGWRLAGLHVVADSVVERRKPQWPENTGVVLKKASSSKAHGTKKTKSKQLGSMRSYGRMKGEELKQEVFMVAAGKEEERRPSAATTTSSNTLKRSKAWRSMQLCEEGPEVERKKHTCWNVEKKRGLNVDIKHMEGLFSRREWKHTAASSSSKERHPAIFTFQQHIQQRKTSSLEQPQTRSDGSRMNGERSPQLEWSAT